MLVVWDLMESNTKWLIGTGDLDAKHERWQETTEATLDEPVRVKEFFNSHDQPIKQKIVSFIGVEAWKEIVDNSILTLEVEDQPHWMATCSGNLASKQLANWCALRHV